MKICGTTIRSCEDDDRPRAVLVSDLHVPRDGGAVLESFETLCAGLHQDAARTRLLVLGDLFDLWVSDAQIEVPQWDRVVRALGAASAAGVSVTVIHGNRDFMLGDRFARAAGCRVHGGGLRARFGERSALLLHGDELCRRDHAYQRAKRLLRNPVTRAALRALPAGLSLRLAGRARATSRTVQARGRAEDDADLRYAATAAAIDLAFAISGCQLLVHGHVHRPARTPLAEGRELVVLPAFDETGVCAGVEGAELRFRDGAGNPVPDYPPRPPR